MVITVPLQIKFSNPTPVPIAIERLIADVYLEKNGQFVPAAKVNEAVSIPSGESTQWLMPTADLQSIFGGNLLNTLVSAGQVYQNQKLRIRSDVTLVVKGISLPMQSITNDVKLS
jgi:hypothetical protein